MFMAMRKQADYPNKVGGAIQCNSLGYLGLLFGKNEDQKQVILETKPLDLLQVLAVPMYGRPQVLNPAPSNANAGNSSQYQN